MPKTPRAVFDDEATIAKNVRIMELFGNPQNVHPAVHVAGTSGKGTICYLVDALLRAHTKRTGLTQSPHVYDIRERIQVNGQLISERKFVQNLNAVTSQVQAADIQPSYFETLIAMAYVEFGSQPLDYMVIETGFGGRLDATNVITREDKICVLNRIGFDHTEVLGNTLEKIAGEKAGIVQPGNHVVALRQEPEVNAVFEKRCQQQHATIQWVEQTGDYQKTNDEMAKAVCRMLAKRDKWSFDEAVAEATLQQVFIPGRFEKRHLKDHLVILDGAHNPQKLSALANRLSRERKVPVSIVFSTGKNKDIAACLKILQPVVKRIIATQYFTKEQDMPVHPAEIEEIVAACNDLGIEVMIEKSARSAVQKALEFPEPIVVTGSFYLLSEVDGMF